MSLYINILFSTLILISHTQIDVHMHSQGHERGVFTVQENSALLLFTRGFAKGFLEVLALQGATEKDLGFQTFSFYALMQP